MVVGTASTMVTARPEQSQILIQHPDAPSPAQPQVSGYLDGGARCTTITLYVISEFECLNLFEFQGAKKLQRSEFQFSGHLPVLWFLLSWTVAKCVTSSWVILLSGTLDNTTLSQRRSQFLFFVFCFLFFFYKHVNDVSAEPSKM